ncbi:MULTISPECIES: hypothetical protein [unclassified Mesorhizobium]|uniref:hypothetical protein n=1 Tax=unclassified Mesorhizobium TaxID=325217 RepID=UPI000FD6D650|nr:MULTISPECIES: hypothetical protein [unclassified Mesorhizobium]TGQ28588.1 hypothetical protein EN859_034435 [Mesorhizobium sp. M00.F.Ca.ET.216.01.1.1]TIS53748.1 MAG: hypothetical protein E5W91_29620 [Mesorhizobium sp.]TIS86107.1 MAG: hypothetical protein E5W89_30330 [Mesorhizobium sp.]TJW03885.1 MAG: hypothetical protein E5W82_31800 [Mesorhizobium sp.]TJW41029.1 MAG: hypothetical protein E5W83_26990 [Mesorhizobium sp.]
MREPTLLPVFGRLGVKPPVAVAATPAISRSMQNVVARMREGLSSHGGLALKLGVMPWTVVVLTAVFFILQA